MVSLKYLPSALLSLLLASTPTALAQSASSSSSAAASTPTSLKIDPQPGSGSYKYAGCYNETTGIEGAGGVRAITGSTTQQPTQNSGMTPTICASLCGSAQYAGLEYGDECWCGPFLSSLSAKLPDSSCNTPCAGNSSAACGGSLTLTLYNRTVSSTKQGVAPGLWGSSSAVGGAVAVIVMMGVWL